MPSAACDGAPADEGQGNGQAAVSKNDEFWIKNEEIVDLKRGILLQTNIFNFK